MALAKAFFRRSSSLTRSCSAMYFSLASRMNRLRLLPCSRAAWSMALRRSSVRTALILIIFLTIVSYIYIPIIHTFSEKTLERLPKADFCSLK